MSIKFYRPSSTEKFVPHEKDESEEQANDLSELKTKLKTALQMPNIMILAGSGTSLGKVKGPSMPDLWKFCIEDSSRKAEADKIISKIKYDLSKPSYQNIEEFLSYCEAYQQINECPVLEDFLIKSKEIILDKCKFDKSSSDLFAHMEFIKKLARRKSKDNRIKLFTTNYDTCFEEAAGKLGITIIDGFTFSAPRIYSPQFFDYDIIKRDSISSPNTPKYLDGVFHIYKLHGSVNWFRREESDGNFTVEQKESNDAKNVCMIFPAKGKYQQSYIQPHLELIAKFLQGIREPNTCLITTGFGFNDDHLSEPIYAALQSNPHLKLIVVDRSVERKFKNLESFSPYWKKFKALADKGLDILFIEADFENFAINIPDLKALSPAENLYQVIHGGTINA
ncbi:SIR2 family protein [Acinetobacter indicus]|uniref:SIR2 family protein n=1 Tax=Acinetobacter indicus TaxID=756892 RepID=UPI000CEB6A65|nr:SIR2 family protein [Acinetobacter indicus]AVH15381.1 SIR2 family protein [Acinetobacter indicus]